MFAQLIVVAVVAVCVVPLVARWLSDGRLVRAGIVLGAFAALVGAAPSASAALPAVQERYFGPGPAMVESCIPGELVIYPGGSHGVLMSQCNEDGVAWCGGDHCWGYLVESDAGGGGTPSEVSLKPFDMPAEDGALISAAVLGVWLAAWGIRAVIDTLRDRKDGD